MMETALDLCRRGCCVGYFPDFVIRLHNQTCVPKFKLSPLDPPKGLSSQTFDVYMIKRKSDIETSYLKKISKSLRMNSNF
jgi:DNA-binding transcriptional LysR family regulator